MSIDIILPIANWEWCFIVSVFPAIFMVMAARYLRESPVFVSHREIKALLKAGRTVDAEALAISAGVEVNTRNSPLVDVFRDESLRPTVFIGTAFLLNWLGVLTFAILGTSYLTSPTGKNIAFTNSVAILIVANVTSFAGYLLFGWLGDKIGRRNAIGTGWLMCGVFFLILVIIPSGQFALSIIFYSLGLACLIGPYSALLFFNAESFPTHTRATGGSLLNALGQIGAVIAGILVTASLSAHWSWSTTAFAWGVVPVFASGIVIWGAKSTNPGTFKKRRTEVVR